MIVKLINTLGYVWLTCAIIFTLGMLYKSLTTNTSQEEKYTERLLIGEISSAYILIALIAIVI
ncbi:hypothetical protein FP435_00390 (plasmid) [Lactobacillus sp. PV037]|uniref:hypothetical protein n=1 Tax=Lactobacillus sp. PV037 TaxID=2594496 RepID=UPI00223FE03E|nr:hypothetical protein [Lactobacillus sp. PV037]QNQ82995.1 hypothetical protein FP435_00390 [Lactobacillus sp. PV037]